MRSQACLIVAIDVAATDAEQPFVAALAELLEGRVGFEADAVSYAEWQTLSGGEAELVLDVHGGVREKLTVADGGVDGN